MSVRSAVARRRAEQRERIALASAWAVSLGARLNVRSVVVFGSTVRGDFNKWSDVDVLVVCDDLPQTARERLDVLMLDAPPGLQPVGWTTAELLERRERGDPIAVECDGAGVVVTAEPPA